MNTKEYQELIMQNYEDIKRLESEADALAFEAFTDVVMILNINRIREIEEEIKRKHFEINMMGHAIIMSRRVKKEISNIEYIRSLRLDN